MSDSTSISHGEIDALMAQIEKRIVAGEQFLDDAPDFTYGRNVRIAEQQRETPPVLPLNRALENVDYGNNA